MNKQKMIETIASKRRPYCEMCGWEVGTDLHHCIVHRMKGHPELDVEENFELLCRDCHNDGHVNSYAHRVGFWNKQVARGYDMSGWYNSLDLKTKENFGA